jgi:hypothetical protein
MKTDKILDAPGHACINLTPLIKQAMASLHQQHNLLWQATRLQP